MSDLGDITIHKNGINKRENLKLFGSLLAVLLLTNLFLEQIQ